MECLSLVLEPLKKLSHEGFLYKGIWLFPLVYSYVADHPEGFKVKVNCFLGFHSKMKLQVKVTYGNVSFLAVHVM